MDPQLNLDGRLFHKPCAKCADCQCQITVSNFAKGETGDQITLLCKTHYFKRFHEGGAYLGGEKYEKMSNRDSLVKGTMEAAKSPLRTNESAPAAADAEPEASPMPVSERRQSFKGASLPATGISVGSMGLVSSSSDASEPAAEPEEPASAPPPVPVTVFDTAALDDALDTTARLEEEEGM